MPANSPNQTLLREAALLLQKQSPDVFAVTARYLGAYARMITADGADINAQEIAAAACDTDKFFQTLARGKAAAHQTIDLEETYQRFLKKPPAPTEQFRRNLRNKFFNLSQPRWPQAPRLLDALKRGDEKAARKIINRVDKDRRGYLVTKVLNMALDQNLPAACQFLIRQNAKDFWQFNDNIKEACRSARFESISAMLSLFKPGSFGALIEKDYAVEWLEATYHNKDPRVCKLLIEQFPVRELPAFRLVKGMLEALRHGSEETACLLVKMAIKRRLKLGSDDIWRLENEILGNRHEKFGVLYVRWYKQTFGTAPNSLLGKTLEFNCVNIAGAIMDIGGDSKYVFTNDKDKLLQFVDCRNSWRDKHTQPVPAGYGLCDADFYNSALSAKIIALFDKHEHNIYGWAAGVMAFNAAGLFQTPERLGKYIKRWGSNQASQPLHDLIQMIRLPAQPNAATDIKAWGDAVIECGPAMAKLVAFADRVPSPSRSIDGRSWSLNATRAACAKFAYARGHENLKLATLCITNGVTEDRFDKALDLINQTQQQPSNLPDINIDGADFGLADCRFYKLANDDIRGLFLGELTGCCQSIGAHGHDCAAHGFASPHSGFYVIENIKGEVLGQCWAWRGTAGELCFDSLERLGNHITDEQWMALLAAFTKRLQETMNHDVTALHVGMGGKTPKNLATHFNAQAATPRDYTGYRDSHSQVIVAKYHLKSKI